MNTDHPGEILARYQIAWTLLPPAIGAAGVMDRLPGWERVYADNRAVIHRRAGERPGEPTGKRAGEPTGGATGVAPR